MTVADQTRDDTGSALGEHPRRRLKALCVDDNADAAHTLTALLRMAGHEVQKAASGDEALRVGAQLVPDAAVLDIGMRDMSGWPSTVGTKLGSALVEG